MSEPPTNAGKSPGTSPRPGGKDCSGTERMKPPSSTFSTTAATHPTTSITSSPTTASSPTTTPSSTKTSSYAAVTRTNSTGTKPEAAAEQTDADKQTAVVADVMDGLALEDYLVALTTLVNPRDILFASRIPLGRMCIYLRTREMAERVAAAPGIPQKGKVINFRKYVSGSTRIFLSNAIPDIPAKTIHNHLSKFGRIVGPINFCRANCSNPLFAHVRVFRRVVHVVVENLAVLPLAIPITHGDTTHTVFLNLDDHTCTNCGRRGHHEARCSVTTQPTADPVPTPTTGKDDAPTVAEKEQEEAAHVAPEKADLPSGPAEVNAEPEAMEVGTAAGLRRPRKRESESPEKTVPKKSDYDYSKV